MRIGTATVVVTLGLALAGCGETTATRNAARDVVVPASAPVTTALGPGTNPHALVVRHARPAEIDDEVVRPPIKEPTCPGGPTVHFDTPEAAMTYLAAAWNRDDLAALCQVTNPNSRFLLNDMHREAVNLRLQKCQPMDIGLYQCSFVHDYPKRMHARGHGQTWLEVAAADNPGWYLLDYVGCG